MRCAEEASVHVGTLHAELRCGLAAHLARPRRWLVAGNVELPAHTDFVTWTAVELAQVSATLEPDASQKLVEHLQLHVRPGRDIQPEHRRARRLRPEKQRERRRTPA